MASNPGIWAANLAPMAQTQDAADGLVPFVIGYQTTATSGTFTVHMGHAPFEYAIESVYGAMLAAGGNNATVQLRKITGATTVNITEAIPLTGLAVSAQFMAQTINATNGKLNAYSDDLLIVTTGSAYVSIAVMCVRMIF